MVLIEGYQALTRDFNITDEDINNNNILNKCRGNPNYYTKFSSYSKTTLEGIIYYCNEKFTNHEINCFFSSKFSDDYIRMNLK